jgi:chorismate mutase
MTGGERRRADVVVSLLAVLELCRQGKIRTQQTELFGDIVIERQTAPESEEVVTLSQTSDADGGFTALGRMETPSAEPS